MVADADRVRRELEGIVGPRRAIGGPDWTQLVLGSEGTLGIITSARLRLSPAPQLKVLRGFEVDNVAAGVEALRRVLQRGLKPAVVRLYDELDTFVNSFGHHHHDAAAAELRHTHAPVPLPGEGALPPLPPPPRATDDDGPLERLLGMVRKARHGLRGDAFTAVLDRPRLINRVVGTVAEKIARKGCKLIIGLEGARLRTEVEAALCFQELAAAGAHDQGEEPGRAWIAHRYAVSYRMSPMFRDGAFVDTMEVATSWATLLDLYHSVRAALGKHAVVMAHFSHAYAEGCSIYFTFAAHADGRAASERRYDAIWKDGLEAATRVGATISHHHGVGMLRAPYMAGEHREAMAILTALKHSFDPDDVMNPGKLGLAARRWEAR